jgi:hypothetical protein
MKLLEEAAITPTRTFSLTYLILDSLFILVLLSLFIYKKKYLTLLFSLFGGVLYFLVDFLLFYLASHSRIVYIDGVEQTAANTALVLLWMSLSYGITNFAFIWLCLRKDQDLKEWLFMIIGWWLIAPSLSQMVPSVSITTYRTTSKYHWIMALILVLSYLGVIIYNLHINSKEKKIDLIRLNLIGISVQFSWEASLLINSIRPLNSSSLLTLLIDSLLETNLGMPLIYLIYKKTTDKYQEDLKKAAEISL